MGDADHKNTFSLRLGFTESLLLFFYWLETIKKISDDSDYIESHSNKNNYFYTATGFYDKKISGAYLKFDIRKCKTSFNYNKYMSSLIKYIKCTDLYLNIPWKNAPSSWVPLPPIVKIYEGDFKEFLSKSVLKFNEGRGAINFDYIYSKIGNKKLLVVNPLSSLAKQQYICGNLNKIYPKFPIVTAVDIVENPYTFFNDGPDNSFFETLEKACEVIKTKDFEIAIISCGAYSSFIGYFIYNTLKCDVITMGGEFHNFFGILCNRNKGKLVGKTNLDHWILVPEILKPKDYNKIENGCYW